MRKGKSGGHEEIMCTARVGEEMMRMVSRGSYWKGVGGVSRRSRRKDVKVRVE